MIVSPFFGSLGSGLTLFVSVLSGSALFDDSEIVLQPSELKSERFWSAICLVYGAGVCPRFCDRA
jgi:hypothetical protein